MSLIDYASCSSEELAAIIEAASAEYNRRGASYMCVITKGNTTYSDVIDCWFAAHKLKVAGSTAYEYQMSLPLTKQYFGATKIKDVSAEVLYNYLQYLEDKYTYNRQSLLIHCKIVKLSMAWALQNGYIIYNPAKAIKWPSGRMRSAIHPFELAEIPLLFAAEAPQWVKDGAMIAFRTGMRQGEIYVLKWSDIDLELGFISVQNAMSRECSKIKTTKTPAGVRRIDIDSKLVAYLRTMKEATGAQCPYVFPPPPHGRYEFRIPSNASHYIRDMCIQAGIYPRDFKTLRHTHATTLLKLGVHPKIVQERLGHSDIKVTMDTYSHVTPTIQRQAVEAMELVP